MNLILSWYYIRYTSSTINKLLQIVTIKQGAKQNLLLLGIPRLKEPPVTTQLARQFLFIRPPTIRNGCLTSMVNKYKGGEGRKAIRVATELVRNFSRFSSLIRGGWFLIWRKRFRTFVITVLDVQVSHQTFSDPELRTKRVGINFEKQLILKIKLSAHSNIKFK